MTPLFILYILIVSVLLVGAFFILYHILRYSLTKTLGIFGALIFIIIFFFLLALNFFSFQSLSAEELLPGIELSPLLENQTMQLTPAKSNPW